MVSEEQRGCRMPENKLPGIVLGKMGRRNVFCRHNYYSTLYFEVVSTKGILNIQRRLSETRGELGGDAVALN